jgi:type VI secretion system protein
MSTAPSLTLTVHIASATRTIMVDGTSATLGRGAGCTVVLTDTRRAISRLQASIEWRDGHYVLTDSGSNPTLVNGRILNVLREAVLRDADRLSIGDYLIELSIGMASASDDTTVLTTRPALSSPAGPAAESMPAEVFDKPTMVRSPGSQRGALT